MPIRCTKCGKVLLYGEANWITTRYDVDRPSRVVSRSLVGGSTAVKTTIVNTPINERKSLKSLLKELIK